MININHLIHFPAARRSEACVDSGFEWLMMEAWTCWCGIGGSSCSKDTGNAITGMYQCLTPSFLGS